MTDNFGWMAREENRKKKDTEGSLSEAIASLQNLTQDTTKQHGLINMGGVYIAYVNNLKKGKIIFLNDMHSEITIRLSGKGKRFNLIEKGDVLGESLCVRSHIDFLNMTVEEREESGNRLDIIPILQGVVSFLEEYHPQNIF